MTLAEKTKELKTKRSALIKKAQKATTKLEKQFRADNSKTSLADKIKSFTGRYYAVVGPIIKEAKELEKAIELLGA